MPDPSIVALHNASVMLFGRPVVFDQLTTICVYADATAPSGKHIRLRAEAALNGVWLSTAPLPGFQDGVSALGPTLAEAARKLTEWMRRERWLRRIIYTTKGENEWTSQT